MKQSRSEVWAKWRALMAEQQASGQSVSRFCFERGLSSGQFFAWKKRLREADGARFVALELAPVAEARWPATIPSRGIEVRLVRNRSLLVEPGFDAHHLRALLLVLEGEA
jgi:transposase-like protein